MLFKVIYYSYWQSQDFFFFSSYVFLWFLYLSCWCLFKQPQLTLTCTWNCIFYILLRCLMRCLKNLASWMQNFLSVHEMGIVEYHLWVDVQTDGWRFRPNSGTLTCLLLVLDHSILWSIHFFFILFYPQYSFFCLQMVVTFTVTDLDYRFFFFFFDK